jgi:hypothetical protein
MKIIHSDDLEAAVEGKLKLGMRDQVKRACTEYIQNQEPWSVIKGMQAATEYADKGQDLILIKVTQGVLIFSLLDKTEAEWVTIVRNVSKKETKTSRKVLVKMAMTRMERIRAWWVGLRREYTTLPAMPDLESTQAIQDFKQIVIDRGRETSMHTEIKELLQLPHKDGADADLLRDAWGLLVAKNIHES